MIGIRVGVIGAGKMGLSHYAIANGLPGSVVAGVCDTSRYVLSVLRKYAGIETYTSYQEMIDKGRLDCVFVCTPTATHFECAKYALERDLHVFVEKPLTLSPAESRALADLATRRKRINMVGFHNRFIGTFREAHRLLRVGALGVVRSIHGSAVGPVVVKQQGSTWRSRKVEGGGCLHDYACHVVDLMNFLVDAPIGVVRARMESIFSRDVEDAVSAAFDYGGGMVGTLETNWSDDTVRKMSTTIKVQCTKGELVVDRQELKVRCGAAFDGYQEGWNTRRITDLHDRAAAFYLRGEEYTAQVAAFFSAIRSDNAASENSFASAYETDRILDLIARADQAAAA
jgi:predicted dehydrogenase